MMLLAGPRGQVFRPFEADATIQNPGDAWFWHEGHAYWKVGFVPIVAFEKQLGPY